MRNENEMKLEFLSKSNNEAFARITVAAFVASLDPTIEEISDNGKGIENIEKAKQPLYTSKPNLERSGMGFTIMESFMDDLNVESVLNLGTKVTMKKVIKKAKDTVESE